jgi:aryl-alcohol dehydrogenase-like predicted oxidoreductase
VQLALPWVLNQGGAIVPSPCTRKPVRIVAKLAAANVRLTTEHLARIDAIGPRGTAVGGTLIGELRHGQLY